MGKLLDKARMRLHCREIRSFVRSLDEGQGVIACMSEDGKNVHVYIVDGLERKPPKDMFYADDDVYHKISNPDMLEFAAHIATAPWFHRPERHWGDEDEQA
jgi:hypothetical protein